MYRRDAGLAGGKPVTRVARDGAQIADAA